MGLAADVVEVLSGVIRAALKVNEEKPRIGVYRPSLLPSCLRRQFLIYKRGLIVSEEKAGLFEIGKLFHDFLSQTFRNSGLIVKAVEAPFFIVSLCGDELIRISGRADLIVEINGEDYIVETKSIKKLPKEPLGHHVEQLQFYLAGYGLKQGFLIYLEKSFLKNSIFPVSFDMEVFRRLLSRTALLHKHLTSDLMPEPDGERWECRFCEFKGECCGEHGAANS